jgi:hypothetical protein
MSYWAVARLEPRREQLALRCLGLAGYETYFPRLRAAYLAWPQDRGPAAALPRLRLHRDRAAMAHGAVDRRRPRSQPARVRVTHGPFSGQFGLYQGQRPRERVLVLLAPLGSQQRVELAAGDIEAAG